MLKRRREADPNRSVLSKALKNILARLEETANQQDEPNKENSGVTQEFAEEVDRAYER